MKVLLHMIPNLPINPIKAGPVFPSVFLAICRRLSEEAILRRGCDRLFALEMAKLDKAVQR